jgi:hypothetical protein
MFIIEGAEQLLPSVQWDPLDPRLQLLRASAAVISSYIFLNRIECSALCLAEDMLVTTDHIALWLWEETRKEGPPRRPPKYEANRMLRLVKSGTLTTCLLRRSRHHGPSPHTPMDPMPRGGQDTMDDIDFIK